MELASSLSQLKQRKVRMSELDWKGLSDISVIGARQFLQGWISILLDVKQNNGSIGMMLFP
jgi:hypothetical protein